MRLKIICIVIVATLSTVSSGECSGGMCSVSAPFSFPFQSQVGGINPILNTSSKKTVSVDGVPVPQGATGYRFVNGQLQWVFGNASSVGGGRFAGGPPVAPPAPAPAPASVPSHCGSCSGGSAPFTPSQRPIEPPTDTFGENSPQVAESTPRPNVSRVNNGENPGFAYSINLGSHIEGCQGTLISDQGGLCVVATAAHCLRSAIENRGNSFDRDFFNRANANTCPNSEVRQRGLFWGKSRVQLPHFGDVEAILYANPDYLTNSNGVEDSGIFTFSCPEGGKRIPVIPLAKAGDGTKNQEDLWYGKVRGDRPGRYRGRVHRRKSQNADRFVELNGRLLGDAWEMPGMRCSSTHRRR